MSERLGHRRAGRDLPQIPERRHAHEDVAGPVDRDALVVLTLRLVERGDDVDLLRRLRRARSDQRDDRRDDEAHSSTAKDTTRSRHADPPSVDLADAARRRAYDRPAIPVSR